MNNLNLNFHENEFSKELSQKLMILEEKIIQDPDADYLLVLSPLSSRLRFLTHQIVSQFLNLMSFSIGVKDRRRTVVSKKDSTNITENTERSKCKRPDLPLYIPRSQRLNNTCPVPSAHCHNASNSSKLIEDARDGYMEEYQIASKANSCNIPSKNDFLIQQNEQTNNTYDHTLDTTIFNYFTNRQNTPNHPPYDTNSNKVNKSNNSNNLIKFSNNSSTINTHHNATTPTTTKQATTPTTTKQPTTPTTTKQPTTPTTTKQPTTPTTTNHQSSYFEHLMNSAQSCPDLPSRSPSKTQSTTPTSDPRSLDPLSSQIRKHLNLSSDHLKYPPNSTIFQPLQNRPHDYLSYCYDGDKVLKYKSYDIKNMDIQRGVDDMYDIEFISNYIDNNNLENRRSNSWRKAKSKKNNNTDKYDNKLSTNDKYTDDNNSGNNDYTDNKYTNNNNSNNNNNAITSYDNNNKNVDDDDDDDWFDKFDEHGNPLDSAAYNELGERLGEERVKGSKVHYFDYTPPDLHDDEYGHLLEIYDFPKEFKTEDLIIAFKNYYSQGFEVKWVDDTHAVAVFCNSFSARSAQCSFSHPFIRVRRINEACKLTKQKLKKSNDFLLPHKERPTMVATVARNLLTGALGIRNTISKEKREQERKILQDARDKKKSVQKMRTDAWEGKF